MTEPFFDVGFFDTSGVYENTASPRPQRVKATRIPASLLRNVAAASAVVVLSLAQVDASSISASVSHATADVQNKPSAYRPAWRNDVLTQLQSLRQLSDNWDGRGASPPSVGVLKKAAAVVERLSVPGLYAPTIFPTSDGAVQLEWHPGSFDVEILIEADESVAVVYGRPDAALEEREVLEPGDLAPVLEALVATLT